MSKSSFQTILSLIVLGAMVFIAYLWYTGELAPRAQVAQSNATGTTGLLQTEPQFRNKLAELRMQRDKVQRGVKQLEARKSETVDHLKSKGIASGADYIKSKDPDVKYAVANLKAWVADIERINKEVAYYDDAINGVEVMLDKLERERISDSVSLKEEEYLELQKIIVDLDERLKVETDVLEDQKLSELLDKEIGSSDDKK